MKNIKSTLNFIKTIIKARHPKEDIRRRELILNILLIGSIVCFLIINIIRVIDLLSHPDDRGLPIIYTLAILFFFIFLFWLSKKGKIKTASLLLITIYSLPMIFSFINWGADLPAALLLSILIIALFGILINHKMVFVSAIIINLFLILLTYFQGNNKIAVINYWRSEKHEISDAIVYMVIILIITAVTWLFSREISRALVRARRSEWALKEERDNLEIKVIERTAQVKEMEKEKINQLYRLAEFGRLSSGIFHDLINPLTAVSLNLEQIQNSQKHELSDAKTCLDQAIIASRKMEDLIISIKKQIQKESSLTTFSINNEIKQIIQLLGYKARKAEIEISFQSKNIIIIYGDPIKFNQIMTNLICNAIESYETKILGEETDKIIKIELAENEKEIILEIIDHGSGIAPENINKIFQPFFSTKIENGRGLGLGLSSSKNLIEKDFNGSINISSVLNKETRFSVTFPKKYEK